MFGAAAGKESATVQGGLSNMASAGHIALAIANFPGAPSFLRKRYGCFAVSQLNYILGDIGTSFVVGEGRKSPRQPASREAFCGLLQLNEECSSTNFSSDSVQNANVRPPAIWHTPPLLWGVQDVQCCNRGSASQP
jgi:hypothetical protein